MLLLLQLDKDLLATKQLFIYIYNLQNVHRIYCIEAIHTWLVISVLGPSQANELQSISISTTTNLNPLNTIICNDGDDFCFLFIRIYFAFGQCRLLTIRILGSCMGSRYENCCHCDWQANNYYDHFRRRLFHCINLNHSQNNAKNHPFHLSRYEREYIWFWAQPFDYIAFWLKEEKKNNRLCRNKRQQKTTSLFLCLFAGP